MTEPAVVVDHVSKKFKLYKERNQTLKSAVMRRKKAVAEEFWAVQDVSFEVPQGSTFGLIGRNGSGKSTLLKCLARILHPDAGTITMNGTAASLLEVGSGFHPELTGRENIFLNGSILGLAKRDINERLDEIISFSGVGKFIDQPVKNYSSGMYVRLGFSVAIHVRPDILVVDEVLAVGDGAFKKKSREKFREFTDSGRTVILVTHSLAQVREMCDQVAWLNQGRLEAVGDAGVVTKQYQAYLDKQDG